MQTTTTIQDSKRARAYFENKVAFTTGPIELSRQLDNHNFNIVDVREAEDYEKGHIPGAVNLPKAGWENAARSLSRDKTNVVYCYTQQCHLAANACVAFASKEFPVTELEGGFETWQENKLRVEQGRQMKASA